MPPTAPASTITPTLRRRRGLTEEAALAAVDQACRRLRLPTIRGVLDEAIEVAKKEQLSYPGFLAELLLAEVDDRDRRSSVRRVKAAQFPRDKWLGDFDFDANPAIEAATIHQLAKGDWIRKGERGLTPVLGHAESSTWCWGSEMIRESWLGRTIPRSSVVRPSTCTRPPRVPRSAA